ncbi:PepSY domain-containing protein [Alkalicoccus chagannorensis]|uniref:PepSY domain-containing protein n=1 Tax=Alkalicoccus chagannorensis TaxID=427072 RepID=UPI0004129F44|nr:PepSY domain-containing protein [Alkalicoccus chagannorensis]
MKRTMLALAAMIVIGGTSAFALTGDEPDADLSELDKSPAEQEQITAEEAAEAAKTKAEDALDEAELEVDHGRLVYEVELEARGEAHELHVDAYTGDVVTAVEDLFESEEADPEPSVSATEEAETQDEQLTGRQAADIALNYIGKGYVDDIDLEWEDGLLVYEIEVEHVDDDVDVYVDAYTGDVLGVDD